mmetsp:Transcript_47446/g.133954  ORF Transcript_47446/g.133954 Transcript_47446/m.133954 type:complete len:222 (+) Transcript_47446:251-916(+)
MPGSVSRDCLFAGTCPLKRSATAAAMATIRLAFRPRHATPSSSISSRTSGDVAASAAVALPDPDCCSHQAFSLATLPRTAASVSWSGFALSNSGWSRHATSICSLKPSGLSPGPARSQTLSKIRGSSSKGFSAGAPPWGAFGPGVAPSAPPCRALARRGVLGSSCSGVNMLKKSPATLCLALRRFLPTAFPCPGLVGKPPCVTNSFMASSYVSLMAAAALS